MLALASFTMALLTLPIVIVTTEEAISSVPASLKEGSYACGATKWQNHTSIGIALCQTWNHHRNDPVRGARSG